MQITCSNLRHDDTVVEFDDALVFRGRRKRSEHEKRQHDSRHGSRLKFTPGCQLSRIISFLRHLCCCYGSGRSERYQRCGRRQFSR